MGGLVGWGETSDKGVMVTSNGMYMYKYCTY